MSNPNPRRSYEPLIPLLLGLALAASAAALVMVELAEPLRTDAFHGIALSNAINSEGARAGVRMFRTRLDWLPFSLSNRTLSPSRYLWGLRSAILSMAAVQIACLAWILSRRATSLKPYLFGAALAVIVLLPYPPISTDVFSYSSFGWESNHGHNPYLESPLAASRSLTDPFAKMNDWERIATPYGPVWTGLSRLVVLGGDEDPFAVAIVFKLIGGLAAIGLGLLAHRAVLRLGAGRTNATAAFVLVAWSPILLIESAGTAHNDALMSAIALAGLLVATSDRAHALRAGLLLMTLAVLVKPVALPLLILTGAMRLIQPRRSRTQLAQRWVVDAFAIGLLVVVCFLPFWQGWDLPHAIWREQKSLYFAKPLKVNPLWVWAIPHAAKSIGGGDGLRISVKHGTGVSQRLAEIALIVAALFALAPAVRRGRSALDWRRIGLESQVRAWCAATIGLGLIPVNAHAWYAVWPLAPMAILACSSSRKRVRLVTMAVLGWMMLSFLVYHTWRSVDVS